MQLLSVASPKSNDGGVFFVIELQALGLNKDHKFDWANNYYYQRERYSS